MIIGEVPMQSKAVSVSEQNPRENSVELFQIFQVHRVKVSLFQLVSCFLTSFSLSLLYVMTPLRGIIIGALTHVHHELEAMSKKYPIAYVQAKSREQFLQDCQSEKYKDVVAAVLSYEAIPVSDIIHGSLFCIIVLYILCRHWVLSIRSLLISFLQSMYQIVGNESAALANIQTDSLSL